MPGSAQPRIPFAEYIDLLKAFNQADVEALVVGGQAVNFWAEFFEENEPELRRYRPFTSVDLDLHCPSLVAGQLLRSHAAEYEKERDPFGKAFTIVSHTFLIQGTRGRLIPVDSLKMGSGLKAAELKRGAVTVEFNGVAVRVLNPISCLKAKLHNLRTIDQRGRQDEKHLCMLLPSIRAFFRGLILEAEGKGNARPALTGFQQFLNCTSRREVLTTAHAHRLDLLQAMPLAELSQSQHPKLVNFRSKRLPEWQHLVSSVS